MPNELYHYGVKGMRWGVRKDQKKEYGMSKGEVKRAIKTAKRNYRKNENPYHTYDGSTGKNWEKVKSKHKNEIDNDSEIKDLTKKRNSAYAKAMSYYNKGNIEVSERYQQIGDLHQGEITARSKKIGKAYANAYKDALLKDINYKNVSKGREMLDAYGISNEWGKHR